MSKFDNFKLKIDNKMNNLMVLNLSVDMTEDELVDCIQKMGPVCAETRDGFFLCISGYDNDKRELWQIPEAVNFFKKIIKLGMMSLLEVSSSIEGVCRLDKKITDIGFPGFGAVEIWLISKGKLQKEISKDLMNEFFNELFESNKIMEKTILRPKPNVRSSYQFENMIEKYKFDGTFKKELKKQLTKDTVISEGQNQFKGINRG